MLSWLRYDDRRTGSTDSGWRMATSPSAAAEIRPSRNTFRARLQAHAEAAVYGILPLGAEASPIIPELERMAMHQLAFHRGECCFCANAIRFMMSERHLDEWPAGWTLRRETVEIERLHMVFGAGGTGLKPLSLPTSFPAFITGFS